MINPIVETNTKSYRKLTVLYKNGSIRYGDNQTLIKQPDFVYVVDIVKEKYGIIAATLYGHYLHFCYHKQQPFNASYGVTAIKVRASLESVRKNEKVLIKAGLISKTGKGDITPRVDSEFSLSMSGRYNAASKSAKFEGRKPRSYKYSFSRLPQLIRGRLNVSLRNEIYAESVMLERVAYQHVNGFEDYKYNAGTYKASAKQWGVSSPTAKTILESLEKANRFIRDIKVKTLLLKLPPLTMRLVKESVIAIKKSLAINFNDHNEYSTGINPAPN